MVKTCHSQPTLAVQPPAERPSQGSLVLTGHNAELELHSSFSIKTTAILRTRVKSEEFPVHVRCWSWDESGGGGTHCSAVQPIGMFEECLTNKQQAEPGLARAGPTTPPRHHSHQPTTPQLALAHHTTARTSPPHHHSHQPTTPPLALAASCNLTIV